VKTERWKVQIDFDLAKRIDLRAANKKSDWKSGWQEDLILFRDDTAQYFHDDGDGITSTKSDSVWCEISRILLK
jgi:hypothetical protein